MTKHEELIQEARAQVAYMTSFAPAGMGDVEPGSMIDFVVRLSDALESFPTPPAPGTKTAAQLLQMRRDAGLTAADIIKDYSGSGYCGRGICAAMEGHAGTCAEASGWAVDGEPEREALLLIIDANTDQARLSDYGDVSFTSDIDELADAILAAGYRRQPEPREVTTVEELDALPVGTLIREYDGFRRLKEGKWSWLLCISGGGLGASDEIEFPAIILFTPSTEETP